jgi:hypothetical protein
MTRLGGGPWRCHHTGPGTYDETARRVDHAEYAVAQLLVQEGHHVRSLPERRGQGRTPDFLACGVTVEVKAFLSLEDRRGRLPDAGKVANKMIDARDQGAVTFIWGGGSGLSEVTARSGYLLFCQNSLEKGLGRTRSIRVLGEGFDTRFDPIADLRAAWQPLRAPRPAPARSRNKGGPRPSRARDPGVRGALAARGHNKHEAVLGQQRPSARGNVPRTNNMPAPHM